MKILNRRVLCNDVRLSAISANGSAGGLADGSESRVLQDARAFLLGELREKVVDGGGAGEGDGVDGVGGDEGAQLFEVEVGGDGAVGDGEVDLASAAAELV